jgi:hypothetical protein
VYPAGRGDTGEVVMFGLSKTKTLTGLQKSLFGAYFREKQLQPCGAGSNDKCRGVAFD